MWVDLVAWLQSPGGARVLQTAIIPALAIVVAGVLAALIARSAVRATLRRAERVEAASAVAGLVAAARTAVDAEDDPVALRRAVRLRTEADVRTRLLPLAGSDLAADWANARMDALALLAPDRPVTAELAELRDRLVEWVGKPSRAKRIFTASVPQASQVAAPEPAAAPEPEPAAAAAPPAVTQTDVAASPQPETEPVDAERFTRPGPRRTPPAPEQVGQTMAEPDPELETSATIGAPSVSAAASSVSADALPAWQRTRAVERLQQERGRARSAEAPTAEEEPVGLGTAPVQHPHRAEEARAAAAAEAVRLEAHQQARHARPTEQLAAATGAVPTAAPTPAPAWLDTYDDEAQVTQNLDLKTPPPVSATSVRDRGPNDDLVPRS